MPRENRGPRLERNEHGTWEIRWTEQGRSKRISTRETALEAAQQVLAGWLIESRAAPTAADRMTIAEVLNAYQTEHIESSRVAMAESVTGRLDRLREGIGHLVVAGLTQTEMDAYEARRRAGEVGRATQSTGTLRLEYAYLNAALRHAVKRKRLPQGVAPVLSLPPESPRRERWLAPEECARLVAAARGKPGERLPRIYRFVMLALHTASRRQALEGLRWFQVDFANRLIHLNPPGRRQTSKRRPSVAINEPLLEMLTQARSEMETEYVLDHPAEIRQSFNALVARAGLGPDVTAHTLRHTWATLASMRGVPLWHVANMLGDSIQTVTRVYAKFSPTPLHDVARQMQDLGSVVAPEGSATPGVNARSGPKA